jgi:hypothetical protein
MIMIRSVVVSTSPSLKCCDAPAGRRRAGFIVGFPQPGAIDHQRRDGKSKADPGRRNYTPSPFERLSDRRYRQQRPPHTIQNTTNAALRYTGAPCLADAHALATSVQNCSSHEKNPWVGAGEAYNALIPLNDEDAASRALSVMTCSLVESSRRRLRRPCRASQSPHG